MNKQVLNILMLEDDAMDAELNKCQLHLLEEYDCSVTWVTDRPSFLNALNDSTPDIILSDFNLPQYNGLEALADLKTIKPLIPFIFVTGTIDEETAADTIKAGAWDYVVKDRLFRLPFAIRGALKLKEERINSNQIESRNRQLSMALEQSPVHIVIVNILGKIEYVNAKFTEITGFKADEIIGKDAKELVPELFSEQHFPIIWDSLKANDYWHGEGHTLKKDGSICWEYISVAPLKDNDGNFTHFIAVKEDISPRKKMEQELIEARDLAQRSDKLKEAFLQNLSHEIRTPLNAIVGFSRLLNEPEVDRNQQSEFTSIILNCSNQLLSIVSDVLTISRIQTGQEFVVVKPLPLNLLLENLHSVFQPRALEKRLKFTLEKDNDDPNYKIRSDETKLTQILTNLLNNAFKFTHEGEITFGYKIKEANLEFFVKDTGIGIEKDAQTLVFERFRQADSSISVRYGGTGLGLSISKSFANMIGGAIGLESEIGKGSTFYLTIPIKTDAPAAIPSGTRISANLPEKPITILVAEDETFNYRLIAAYLNDKIFKLVHAHNGREAIDLCEQNPDIELILMDIKMPGIDGVTAMTEIKKKRFSLPIIAQTAYALEHEKQHLLDKGFDGYISKPIKKEELIEKIKEFI